MHHNRRPQQHTGPLAAEADVSKIQRGERTVYHHPIKRLAVRAARPAGYSKTNQSDTGEAAHHFTCADDLGAEQKPNYEQRVHQQDESRGPLCCRRESKNDSHLIGSANWGLLTGATANGFNVAALIVVGEPPTFSLFAS